MWAWLARQRKRPLRDWLRVAEIALLLGLARLVLLVVPFRHIARFLGTPQRESPEELAANKEQCARHLGGLIDRMARYVPWDAKCFAQAITGKVMLGWRRIPSTLYLGVDPHHADGFAAHAWLRSGRVYVTGGNGHEAYHVLTCYGPAA